MRTALAPAIVVSIASAIAAAQVVRTADPVKRGLTEADFPRVQRLADGVYTYEALRSAGDERFTTVSLFVVSEAGVLVADGQGNVAETTRLLEAIRRVTPLPIRHLVIGSDHGDHTAGNAAFPADVTTYVHPASRATLEAAAAGRAGGARTALPGRIVPVDDRTTLTLGGRTIEIRFLGRAHTGGDLFVHLPAEKILFMSEAYLNRVFPAMRSAYPSEWAATIARAQALEVDVFVPGHGFVESPAILKEELEAFRKAILQVVAEGRRLHAAGLPVDRAVDEARFGALDGWSLRSSQGPIAIRRVYLEIEGRIGGSPVARQ